jgi:hypothetical protein
MKLNSAMIESYVRNLAGQVIAAVTIVSQAANVSVVDFDGSQWKLVANALWASLVPVALRYVNKKDPAFGLVAKEAAAVLTAKVDKATKAKKASK